MLFWGKKKDGATESKSGRRGRGGDALVEAVTERYDSAAAAELSRRGWQPTTSEERLGWAIASRSYEGLGSMGDAAIYALERSAQTHNWSSPVLEALRTIGTPAAMECLGRAIRLRWRREQWDSYCAQMLREHVGVDAMAAELCDRFDPQVARLLAGVGWHPKSVEEHVAVAISERDCERAAQYGKPAASGLIRALTHVGDKYSILAALALIRSPEASDAIITTLHEQWQQGHARWTDMNLVASCGGAAIGPLVRLLRTDPTHASLVVDILTAVLDNPGQISTNDLRLAARMPDPTHLHYLPDDPRGYENVVDCSGLRSLAQAELYRRGASEQAEPSAADDAPS